MGWKAYEVALRLCSPLHSGWDVAGNLLLTRPYVTGRMIWGALTMRLTRDGTNTGPAVDSRDYRRTGDEVDKTLAFSYFYPALEEGGKYKVSWPWEDERDFRRRFLGSYAGTALAYPHQSAAEGSLHEVEFLSPRTMDDGRPVFLLGYIFEHDKCAVDWRSTLERLQFGGERGYGWGRMKPTEGGIRKVDDRIFDGAAKWIDGERPSLSLKSGRRIFAHAFCKAGDGPDLPVKGVVEPLVGREWKTGKYVGQHVGLSGVCFAPGGELTKDASFIIEARGLWRCQNLPGRD